ncbi:arsenite methyltransferase [Candidatus Bathyarchaeota archaeon]|nr:arsenite methyltransferase [Candidatus Bathyarchaeota archaeon]
MARSSGGSCCGPAQASSCCSTGSCNSQAAYSKEELNSLPMSTATASAGCGNPTAIAGLKPGETVLDLGSGGGIDVFLAANKVGPSGRAIGVDMTPDMIELARRNAGESGLENVEFRLGEIEHLPVADDSVDVVISNCVINLSIDKDAVFREAYRALRRGGRIVVSDIMADGLPSELKEDMTSWAGCVGGAMPLGEYVAKIKAAGFSRVEVIANSDYPHDFLVDSMRASGIDLDLAEVRVSHAEVQAFKLG